MTRPFSATDVLDGLKDFQRASAEHAFRRLYTDPDSSRRFLIADETGLGKTFVARGVIAQTIEHLQHDDSVKRIDIIYVCSNADIADQNLSKLTVAGNHRTTPATRLTMLVTKPRLLETAARDGVKPVTFVSFTPATSFDFGWQTGKAEERSVLYLLLADHLQLSRADSTALKRILVGNVKTLESLERHYINLVRYMTRDGWQPDIHRTFLHAFDSSPVRTATLELIDAVRNKRSKLTGDLAEQARQLTAELRRTLARSSVGALEPDLVILDEFQRFKRLLTPGTESAELALHLFDQPAARVLLLSATPYKPFTYAEEAATGENHYQDLIDTLHFLAQDTDQVDKIRTGLGAFRTAALAGRPIDDTRTYLETALRKLLTRVERPGDQAGHTSTTAAHIEPADLAGYVALHQVAQAVDGPLTVEYWKSSPYFANFLDGYKLGEKVKEGLRKPDSHTELAALLRRTQRLDADTVERFQPIDWGNARLRQLAADTIDHGWWQLLWVPPSLPYHAPAGPYASPNTQNMTKRVVFSSWVAAPTAIASLLSYETERRIRTQAGNRFTRDPIRPRLTLKVTNGRAASMTALGLFWPMPALAALTDPRHAARQLGNNATTDDVAQWAIDRTVRLTGPSGTSTTSQAAAWYWAGPLAHGTGPITADLIDADVIDVLTGDVDDSDDAVRNETPNDDTPLAIAAHLDEARRALNGHVPDIERPHDYAETVALLGLASPGNVAWRALQRILPLDHTVTELGLWRAASLLASGFHRLFNRPESMLLLDGLSPSDDDTYWQRVLTYCRDGNLQAVVDEYLHHLAGSDDPITDDASLLKLAATAHRSLTLRGSTYKATDPERATTEGITFSPRIALRFGGIKQTQDDLRLPEVRSAFNSPFWPFVLATTSIGQEGIDLHWWCHGIVHWNLPSNPVDFEQREGRINRFKGHMIRKNVAATHGAEVLGSDADDVWTALFTTAERPRNPHLGDMQPYWHFPGPAAIERSVLSYPMSCDMQKWDQLKDVLALYRLAYGQPRQDDMIDLLQRRNVTTDDLSKLTLRLTPPSTP